MPEEVERLCIERGIRMMEKRRVVARVLFEAEVARRAGDPIANGTER